MSLTRFQDTRQTQKSIVSHIVAMNMWTLKLKNVVQLTIAQKLKYLGVTLQ